MVIGYSPMLSVFYATVLAFAMSALAPDTALGPRKLLIAILVIGAGAAARDYLRHWTPVHIDVVVDDFDEALIRAVAAGAIQEGAVREAGWGRIVQLADPFGHGWCLLQFHGRGYDEIATQ